MVTKELSEAAVEINSIFENMSVDLLNKIPKKFKIFFIRIASKDYKFEYNKTISLNEQKLLPQTKGILALIYRDYLCDEIEKENYNKEYNRVLMLKEHEKQEKYNPNNLFKSNITENNYSNINVLPIEYKNISLFRKIIEKLKNIKKKTKVGFTFVNADFGFSNNHPFLMIFVLRFSSSDLCKTVYIIPDKLSQTQSCLVDFGSCAIFTRWTLFVM